MTGSTVQQTHAVETVSSPGGVQAHVLPNGLKILLREEHSLPVVSCLAWYHVGSRNESAGLTGLSHVVEHMLFQNVGTFRKGELGATIVRNGGQFNGFTSDDFTAFFETLHPSKLDLALRIEADRMRKANFTAENLKEEITRINADMDQESQDSQNALAREVRATAFLRHPYRNPTIGWKTDLENITVQDVRSFYDRYYHPDNATIVLVGDFKSQSALAAINKYFGVFPKAPHLVPPKITEAPQRSERKLSMRYQGKKDIVQLAYHAPSFSDEDAPALVIVEKLLNAAYSGRLRKLAESKVIYSGRSAFELKKDPGLFTITLNIAPGTSAKLMEAWDGLVVQLKGQSISEAELHRAKNQAEFAYICERDGPYKYGFNLGFFDSLVGWQASEGWAQKLKTVSAADLQRVVRKYFAPENRVVGLLSAPVPVPKPPQTVSPPGTKPLIHQSPSAETQQGNPANPRRQFGHVQLTGYKSRDDRLPADREYGDKTMRIAQSVPNVSGVESIHDSASQATPDSSRSPLPDAGSNQNSPGGSTEGSSQTQAPLATPASLPPPASTSTPPVPAPVAMPVPAPVAMPTPASTDNPAALPGSSDSSASQTSAGQPSASQPPTSPTTLPPAETTLVKPTSAAMQTRILKNGIKLIVLENKLTPLIQVAGAIRAGAAFEPPTKRGISDVLSALLNNGTAKTNKSQMQTIQEDLGLTPPTMLHFDSTADVITFKTKCLARDLSTLLRQTAACLADQATQDGDLDKAKQDVFGQYKSTNESSSLMAQRALLRTLLAPDSAYYPEDLNRKSISVGALKTADLADFRSQFLTPEATTLVLVGDINIDVAARIIEQSFANWPHKGGAPKAFPTVTANSRHALKSSIPVRDRSKTFVALGGLLPAQADGTNYASLMLADCVMTNHPIFSRLAQSFGSDPHLSESFSADSIESKFTPLGDSMVWSIDLPVQPNVVSAAAGMVQTELRKFARTGVTNEEFNEVKRYLVCSLPLRQLSNDTEAAKSILDGSIHGNGKLFYSELAGKLRSCTLDNLNKFIRSEFKPDQATLVVAGTKETLRSVHGTRSNGANGAARSSTGDDAKAKEATNDN